MKLALMILALALVAPVLPAQTQLTNDDVVKLSSAGLSESVITEIIDQQGSSLRGDVTNLIQLKRGGVNERIIGVVAKKATSVEPLNTDSVLRLVDAKFSDGFIVDLIGQRKGQFSTDAARIIELKQAGVSDRLLGLMISQGPGKELPLGTKINVRLIDGVDSEINKVGDKFDASLEDALVVGTEVIAPKGARAVVRLVDAKESGKVTGRTELTLQLVSITINGKPTTINGAEIDKESGSRGVRTAKSAAVVGGIGALIGGIAGGGQGAAIGAAAGAGAGAGAQIFMDPQKVKLPSETVLVFVTAGNSAL